jgi:hypothetical protein
VWPSRAIRRSRRPAISVGPAASARLGGEHFGALHPVAAQTIEVLGEGVALAGDALHRGRQRGERRAGESLVAEKMIGDDDAY